MTHPPATQIIIPPPQRTPWLLIVCAGCLVVAAVGGLLAIDNGDRPPLPPTYQAPQLPAWMLTPPATYSNVVFVATQVPTPEPTPRSTNTPAPFQTYTPTVPICGTEAPGSYCNVLAPTPTETSVPICPVAQGGCFWPTATETTEAPTSAPLGGMR